MSTFTSIISSQLTAAAVTISTIDGLGDITGKLCVEKGRPELDAYLANASPQLSANQIAHAPLNECVDKIQGPDPKFQARTDPCSGPPGSRVGKRGSGGRAWRSVIGPSFSGGISRLFPCTPTPHLILRRRCCRTGPFSSGSQTPTTSTTATVRLRCRWGCLHRASFAQLRVPHITSDIASC